MTCPTFSPYDMGGRFAADAHVPVLVNSGDVLAIAELRGAQSELLYRVSLPPQGVLELGLGFDSRASWRLWSPVRHRARVGLGLVRYLDPKGS